MIWQSKHHTAVNRHTDWDRDVCSLAVANLNAPVVALGDTGAVKVGQRVYAIGAPQGLELTLSEGIVSSLREVENGHYIQTTTPISPGSSGGGLFDEEGRLLGLPTFFLAEGQQLNFAVPVEWVTELPRHHVVSSEDTSSGLRWYNEALDLERRKDWLALLRHTQQGTKSRPKNASAWFLLGLAYWHLEQHAKAVDAYRQTLRIKPGYFDAWVNLGSEYMVLGQDASAREAYQQAVHINPESAVAWYSLSIVYSSLAQHAKSFQANQQALRIKPDYVDAWVGLGLDYVQLGQYADAIEAYQQALRINPESAMAWTNLGIAYRRMGDTKLTLEVYHRLKTLDSKLAEWFFNEVILPQQ